MTKHTASEVVSELRSAFTERGIAVTDAGLRGMAANFGWESGFDTTATNKTGGDYGLAQMTGPRKAELKSRANFDTLPVQARHIVDEIVSSSLYSKTLSAITNPNLSAKQVTKTVLENYERPPVKNLNDRLGVLAGIPGAPPTPTPAAKPTATAIAAFARNPAPVKDLPTYSTHIAQSAIPTARPAPIQTARNTPAIAAQPAAYTRNNPAPTTAVASRAAPVRSVPTTSVSPPADANYGAPDLAPPSAAQRAFGRSPTQTADQVTSPSLERALDIAEDISREAVERNRTAGRVAAPAQAEHVTNPSLERAFDIAEDIGRQAQERNKAAVDTARVGYTGQRDHWSDNVDEDAARSMANVVDMARAAGIDLNINSSHRTADEHAALGRKAARSSSHLSRSDRANKKGKAKAHGFDISTKGMSKKQKGLLNDILSYNGFRTFGDYPTHKHADKMTKAPPVSEKNVDDVEKFARQAQVAQFDRIGQTAQTAPTPVSRASAIAARSQPKTIGGYLASLGVTPAKTNAAPAPTKGFTSLDARAQQARNAAPAVARNTPTSNPHPGLSPPSARSAPARTAGFTSAPPSIDSLARQAVERSRVSASLQDDPALAGSRFDRAFNAPTRNAPPGLAAALSDRAKSFGQPASRVANAPPKSVQTSRVTAPRSLEALPNSRVASGFDALNRAGIPSAPVAGLPSRNAPTGPVVNANLTSPAIDTARTAPARAAPTPVGFTSIDARAQMARNVPTARHAALPVDAIDIPTPMARPAITTQRPGFVAAPVTTARRAPGVVPVSNPARTAPTAPTGFRSSLSNALSSARAARATTNAARATDELGILPGVLSQSPTGGFLGDRTSRDAVPGVGSRNSDPLGRAVGRGLGDADLAGRAGVSGGGPGSFGGRPGGLGGLGGFFGGLADDIGGFLGGLGRAPGSSPGKSSGFGRSGKSSTGGRGKSGKSGRGGRGGKSGNPGGSGNSDID